MKFVKCEFLNIILMRSNMYFTPQRLDPQTYLKLLTFLVLKIKDTLKMPWMHLNIINNM